MALAPLTGQDLRTMRAVGLNGAGFQTAMAKELEAKLNAQEAGLANQYANAYSPRGQYFNEALGRFAAGTNEYLDTSKANFPDPDGPKHLAAKKWHFTDTSAVPATWPEVDTGIGMPSVQPV